MNKWYTAKGEHNDVILSTRVRFARNLENFPFPCRLDADGKEAVCMTVKEALADVSGIKLHYIDMNDLTEKQAVGLAERHLISPEFTSGGKGRALLLSEDESVSIMLCEEDHIRIQVIKGGLDLEGAYDLANKIDDLLDSKLKYAFDERIGYLTQCPTNIGTGMRASVMMHLPGLTLTKRLGILDQLGNFGMTVRGLFGEGSQSVGDLYQISNQSAIGQSEKDILTNLKSVTQQIIKEERNARNFLKEQNGLRLSDKIWRAYGTLSNARYMSSREALELISLVRLGYHLGYFTDLESKQVDQLYLMAQPGYLQVVYGHDMDEVARDSYRAAKLRTAIKGDE